MMSLSRSRLFALDLLPRSWIVLGLATAASVTGSGDGAPLAMVTMALLAIVIVIGMPEPESLLPALLPLAFMLGTAPLGIGWREASYAAVCIVAVAGTLVHFRAQTMEFLRRTAWWLAASVALLGINLAVALGNDVPLRDWMRGLAPFLFLVVAIPAAIALRCRPVLTTPLLVSASMAALLFAGDALLRYLWHGMWVPAGYVQRGEEWIQATAAQAEAMGLPLQWFSQRVTSVSPGSLDALLPLALVWSTWTTLWGQRSWVRALGFLAGALAVVSVLISYTRSTVLVAAAVSGLIMLDAFIAGIRVRAAIFAGSMLVVALATIWIFGLSSIYGVRFLMLSNSLQSPEAHQSVADTPVPLGQGRRPSIKYVAVPGSGASSDATVLVRLQEIGIAWRMFLASPVVGHGLGVRYRIVSWSNDNEQTSDLRGYVHNWPFYVLMVGGVLGAACYVFLLFGAPVVAWRRLDPATLRLVAATVLLLAAYGSLTAAYRLIPFNLVLGGVWALALTPERRVTIAAS